MTKERVIWNISLFFIRVCEHKLPIVSFYYGVENCSYLYLCVSILNLCIVKTSIFDKLFSDLTKLI